MYALLVPVGVMLVASGVTHGTTAPSKKYGRGLGVNVIEPNPLAVAFCDSATHTRVGSIAEQNGNPTIYAFGGIPGSPLAVIVRRNLSAAPRAKPVMTFDPAVTDSPPMVVGAVVPGGVIGGEFVHRRASFE